jgi:hypothetical protein
MRGPQLRQKKYFVVPSILQALVAALCSEYLDENKQGLTGRNLLETISWCIITPTACFGHPFSRERLFSSAKFRFQLSQTVSVFA